MNRISIIIPAYNEERNLPVIINNLRQLDGYDLEIIVVDDGSLDKTTRVAQDLEVKTVSYKPNRGKGAAFREALFCVNNDYVVQIDADSQFKPSDISALMSKLMNGSDIVFGSRFKGGVIEKGSMSIISRLGNWVISLVASMFSGHRIYDVMAGFKAFKADKLRALDLKCDHFGYEAEILIKAESLGFNVDEAPIRYARRIDGKSSVKKMKDGIRVLLTIISTKLNCLRP